MVRTWRLNRKTVTLQVKFTMEARNDGKLQSSLTSVTEYDAAHVLIWTKISTSGDEYRKTNERQMFTLGGL